MNAVAAGVLEVLLAELIVIGSDEIIRIYVLRLQVAVVQVKLKLR